MYTFCIIYETTDESQDEGTLVKSALSYTPMHCKSIYKKCYCQIGKILTKERNKYPMYKLRSVKGLFYNHDPWKDA